MTKNEKKLKKLWDQKRMALKFSRYNEAKRINESIEQLLKEMEIKA